MGLVGLRVKASDGGEGRSRVKEEKVPSSAEDDGGWEILVVVPQQLQEAEVVVEKTAEQKEY